ncbi:cell wall-binding repeat-containing protein [Euzebya pacifica]|uniref:cell wall-binding repeat-containing protein n=1 Tax=Euzebya pacifica TaxID=1608957 RepID=UPI0030F92359
MSKPALLLAILLIATLLSPAPTTAQDTASNDAAEPFSSANMSHIDNLAYRVLDRAETTIPYGTDIEFATLDGGSGRTIRLEGPTRIETAAAISADTYLAADDVVIATAYTYADALAGAPLAGLLRAPILLTTVEQVPAATMAEIARLGARRAVVLGGEAAVSAAVLDQLTAAGLSVERIEGSNRFGTAAAIADRVTGAGEFLLAVGEDSDPERGWETALAAASLGAAHDIPLLLLGEDRLPEETAAVLAASAPTDPVTGQGPAIPGASGDPAALTVVGTTGQVSEAVVTEAEEAAGGATSTRIEGDDVHDVAAAVAAESFARGAIRARAHVATSRAFADGLTTAAAIGKTGGVLYLVDGLDIAATPQAGAALADATVGVLRLAGGTSAIDGEAATTLSALVADRDGSLQDYAIAGAEYNGLQIADIADPERTEIVAYYDCVTVQGDTQVFSRDGRTFTTFTSEDTTRLDHRSDCVRSAVAAGDITFVDEVGGGEDEDQPDGTPDDLTPGYGTYVIELTNPYEPAYAGFIPVPEGSHNMTVHPSGDYAYNSNSSLITNPVTSGGAESTYIEYYDISDLSAITRLGQLDMPVLPGLGTESHDITFSADGTRAYSAALSNTVIINTEDPANPEVISNFVDPAINVEHQADPVTVTDSDGNERTLLIVEDELAGAAGNGFCPGGGMHIYDITGDNELDPQTHKVGTYFIPDFRPAGTGSGQGEALTCTAHVFRIYPEQGIVTIAWYNAGVWVLDINGLADGATDPTSMPIETLGFFYFSNSDTWSFKTNTFEEDGSFYGYGNDINRGLDVYRFDASVDTATEEFGESFAGRWVNQPTAITMAQRALLANGYALGEQAAPRCLVLSEQSSSEQGI